MDAVDGQGVSGLIDAAESSRKSVAIACTLRSGSNLLCEILERKGYGRPSEYFQERRYSNEGAAECGENSNLKTVEQVSREFLATHDGAPWLGVKWSWIQFDAFFESINKSSTQSFSDVFPDLTWIRLGRRNRAKQAISLLLADQTGIWVKGDVSNFQAAPEYKFQQIWDKLSYIEYEELMWSRYFSINNIKPLHLFYEDLLLYPHLCEENIDVYLSTHNDELRDFAYDDGALVNQRLRTKMNEQYEEWFYRDLRAAGGPLPLVTTFGVESGRQYDVDGEDGARVFADFAQGIAGRYPLVEKLPLDDTFQFEGRVKRIVEAHFLDGFAYWLERGSNARAEVVTNGILLSFVAHPWSGVAEISFDSDKQLVDLYSPVVTTKTVVHQWQSTDRHTIILRPTGDQGPMAMASQVWLQRFWTRRDRA